MDLVLPYTCGSAVFNGGEVKARSDDFMLTIDEAAELVRVFEGGTNSLMCVHVLKSVHYAIAHCDGEVMVGKARELGFIMMGLGNEFMVCLYDGSISAEDCYISMRRVRAFVAKKHIY